MIPNMSRVVKMYSQPVTIISLTKENDQEFNQVLVKQERAIKAVVQPADKDKLNPAVIDWHLSYFAIHSTSFFETGEFLFYHDKYFKIIDSQNFSDYGYTTGTAEEVKNPRSVGL